MKRRFLLLVFMILASDFSFAKVTLNNVFDNNMVLQREKPVKIWGWAAPGETVSVSFCNQTKNTAADPEGRWSVYLDPMPANAHPESLKVTGSGNQVVYSNILVGDVWVFSGQSNMEFILDRMYDGDIELRASENDMIRLMTVPSNSNKDPFDNFDRIVQWDGWYQRYEDKGTWFPSYSDKSKNFSALGYMFGKTLQKVTRIPIGLIDASRGGTVLESWLSPGKLASMPENAELLKHWKTMLEAYDPEESLAQEIKNWERRTEARKKQGLEPGPKPTQPQPRPDKGLNYPSGSYNGYIAPIKGLTIKGVVFHQGFSNAMQDARTKLYVKNFNALIEDWREVFDDPDLPFGIMEFCACGIPQTLENYEACQMEAAPYVREAQHLAYIHNSNVGYCSAYDLQLNWCHPQNKAPVAVRMARWALSEVYGYKEIVWKPAEVIQVEKRSDCIVVTFDKEVKSSDDRPMAGFSLSAKDGHFYPSKAEYAVKSNTNGRVEYDKKKLIVSNPLVKHPEFVRYAWARNPIANLVSDRFILVPQFRTDAIEFPEAPYPSADPEGYKKHLAKIRALPKEAEKLSKARLVKEAKYYLKNR